MHCLARANDEPQRLPIWREAAALPGTPSKGIKMIAMAELSGAATRTIPDLSFGVSYIRVVEASRRRNGDTLKGYPSPSPAATSPHGRWWPIGRPRCFAVLRYRRMGRSTRVPGEPGKRGSAGRFTLIKCLSGIAILPTWNYVAMSHNGGARKRYNLRDLLFAGIATLSRRRRS